MSSESASRGLRPPVAKQFATVAISALLIGTWLCAAESRPTDGSAESEAARQSSRPFVRIQVQAPPTLERPKAAKTDQTSRRRARKDHDEPAKSPPVAAGQQNGEADPLASDQPSGAVTPEAAEQAPTAGDSIASEAPESPPEEGSPVVPGSPQDAIAEAERLFGTSEPETPDAADDSPTSPDPSALPQFAPHAEEQLADQPENAATDDQRDEQADAATPVTQETPMAEVPTETAVTTADGFPLGPAPLAERPLDETSISPAPTEASSDSAQPALAGDEESDASVRVSLSDQWQSPASPPSSASAFDDRNDSPSTPLEQILPSDSVSSPAPANPLRGTFRRDIPRAFIGDGAFPGSWRTEADTFAAPATTPESGFDEGETSDVVPSRPEADTSLRRSATFLRLVDLLGFVRMPRSGDGERAESAQRPERRGLLFRLSRQGQVAVNETPSQAADTSLVTEFPASTSDESDEEAIGDPEAEPSASEFSSNTTDSAPEAAFDTNSLSREFGETQSPISSVLIRRHDLPQSSPGGSPQGVDEPVATDDWAAESNDFPLGPLSPESAPSQIVEPNPPVTHEAEVVPGEAYSVDAFGTGAETTPPRFRTMVRPAPSFALERPDEFAAESEEADAAPIVEEAEVVPQNVETQPTLESGEPESADETEETDAAFEMQADQQASEPDQQLETAEELAAIPDGHVTAGPSDYLEQLSDYIVVPPLGSYEDAFLPDDQAVETDETSAWSGSADEGASFGNVNDDFFGLDSTEASAGPQNPTARASGQPADEGASWDPGEEDPFDDIFSGDAPGESASDASTAAAARPISLILDQRTSRPLKLSYDAATAFSKDPAVCEVIQFSPRELALVGKRPGTARIEVRPQSDDRPVRVYAVTVRPRDDQVQPAQPYTKLNDLLKELYPASRITLTATDGQIVVTGTAPSAREAMEIISLIRRMRAVPVVDNLRIGGS